MEVSKQRVFTNKQLAQSGMFIALMAIGANLASFITIGTVPLTFQTVIAILCGIILGKKIGTLSMIGYIIVGFIGIPVFAGFQGGLHTIFSPTFGFIISFVVMAYVVGFIFEKWREKNRLTYFIVAYLGIGINYVIGILYLYYYTKYILGTADISIVVITASMIPFLIKDVILTSTVATIAPRILSALKLAK